MALAHATRSLMNRFMRNSQPYRGFASLGEMDISPQMDASSTSIDAWDDFGYQVRPLVTQQTPIASPLELRHRSTAFTCEAVSCVFRLSPCCGMYSRYAARGTKRERNPGQHDVISNAGGQNYERVSLPRFHVQAAASSVQHVCWCRSCILQLCPLAGVLLIGTGEEMLNIDPTLFGHFSRQGISIEHMSSVCPPHGCSVLCVSFTSIMCPQHNAMATFNILNQEGRPAAAALLCRTPVTRDEACFYTNGTHDHVDQLRDSSPGASFDVYDMTATPRGQATRSGDLVSGAYEERRRSASELGLGGGRAKFLEGGAGAKGTAVRSHLND